MSFDRLSNLGQKVWILPFWLGPGLGWCKISLEGQQKCFLKIKLNVKIHAKENSEI